METWRLIWEKLKHEKLRQSWSLINLSLRAGLNFSKRVEKVAMTEKVTYCGWESGWSMGYTPDFHSSNPALTHAQGNPQSMTTKCALNERSFARRILQNIKKVWFDLKSQGSIEYLSSGWSSGKKLELYPSNPGSTPAWVRYRKKRKKPPSLPLMIAKLQGVLKKLFKKTFNIGSAAPALIRAHHTLMCSKKITVPDLLGDKPLSYCFSRLSHHWLRGHTYSITRAAY